MTKDLERTVAELGPGYREVVDRLRAAYRAPSPFVPPVETARESRTGRVLGWTAGYLIAASLLIFLGLSLTYRPTAFPAQLDGRQKLYTVAYAPTEEAIAAIVHSQRADGSWENDFLTQQNAAALRRAEGIDEQIAYRKAVRYLRTKGLRPLSDEELKLRGDAAARTLTRG